MSYQAPGKNLSVSYNSALPGQQAFVAGQQASTGATAAGGYGALAVDPGYSQAEQGAITTAGMNSANAAFNSAGAGISRAAARTGNTAGQYGAMAELGRERAGAVSDQARSNVINFAQEKERRRELGIQGAAGLYGANLDAASRMASLRTSTPSSGGGGSYNGPYD